MDVDMVLWAIPDCRLTEERADALEWLVATVAPDEEELDRAGCDTAGEWREAVRQAIAGVVDAGESNPEVVRLYVSSYPLLVTGGLWWGDVP